MTRTFSLILFTVLALYSFSTQAQMLSSDVCCIMGKADGQGAGSSSWCANKNSCVVGRTLSGYRVCATIPDPENLCPTYETKDLCPKCGYHWTGQSA